MTQRRVKPRERDAIIQALKAGVVPKLGLPHIQVGRGREIEELLRDTERISDGGAAIRFIVGEYGSGKTFFLNLIRLIALEKGLLVLSADLAPARRLHATGGQARSLYAELTHNTATRSKPEGRAMASVVERFANTAVREAEVKGINPDDVIRSKLSSLEDLTGGYDFVHVISKYWQGYDQGNDDLKFAALQWLRGEYSTRTEARKALGVRTIVDDANVYDQLKLLAVFVGKAGYKGLLVVLDELVNLYKLASKQARDANYEQILRILNDVLQGSASHIGFLMGGTPELLMDTRRGLYSYEALQTRLAENTFAREGFVDYSGPVIRLPNLSPEEILVLLRNIRHVVQGDNPVLPDDALTEFMKHCSQKIGDAYFRTPRNTVKAFVDMLSILEQNPSARWQDLLGLVEVEKDLGDVPSEASGVEDDDELATFRL